MTTSGDRQFRVVIADDVPQLRFLLIRALEATGRFRVVAEAADGNEALQWVRAYGPDVIILDLSMPDRGGLDILPQLRDEAPATVVAVYSSVGPDVLGKIVWQSDVHLYSQKNGRISDFVSELLTEMEVQLASTDGPATLVETGGTDETT